MATLYMYTRSMGKFCHPKDRSLWLQPWSRPTSGLLTFSFFVGF